MLKEGVEVLTTPNGVAELSCSLTAGESSRIFELSTVRKIGVDVIAVSSGTVDILIELEVSNTLTNFDEQTGYSDLINLVNTTRYRKTVVDANIPGFKYGRIKAIGQGANAENNTVTGTINLIREE